MIYRGRRTNRRIIAGGVAALALALSPLAAQAAQIPSSPSGYGFAPSSVSAAPVLPKNPTVDPNANGIVFHLPKPTVDPNANGIVFHVPDSKGATTANGV
jgi:hypothetical protein